MTNDIKISRKLALFESIIGKKPDAFLHEPIYQVTESEVLEFARQLAAPAVDRQEPVAIVMEETHNYTNYLVVSGKDSRVERPRPVIEKKAVLLDREIPAGTKLYTSPPATVAVVPEGWKLVPIEPTDDMIVAFAEAWYSKRQTIDDPDMLDAYRDMLAVAPACELNQ